MSNTAEQYYNRSLKHGRSSGYKGTSEKLRTYTNVLITYQLQEKRSPAMPRVRSLCDDEIMEFASGTTLFLDFRCDVLRAWDCITYLNSTLERI